MKYLFLESFYGDSHKAFCEGLIKYSSHDIDLFFLPDCNFKWRIRGSAYYFYKNIKDIEKYDGIITTSMMDISLFRSLYNKKLPPIIFYFHENQIDYPVAENQKFNYDLVFSNINSALSADLILFNSFFHKRSFFDACRKFLNRMPRDYDISWIIDSMINKSEVLYPGCDFINLDHTKHKNSTTPVILWNQRWDFDKNPEIFLLFLKELKKRKVKFDLIILGKESKKLNRIFIEIKRQFENNLLHYGYVKDKAEYFHWLRYSDIVVSTAIQENFGYSSIEAIRYGCLPLLPARLSYPEIIPEMFHEDVLYRNFNSLMDKALKIINKKIYLKKEPFFDLFSAMENFSWENMIGSYNEILEKVLDLS